MHTLIHQRLQWLSEYFEGRYVFNTAGHHSCTNALKHLSEDEWRHLIKFLDNPTHHRHINGWLDVGGHKDPIRVLIQQVPNGADRVFYLFGLSDHTKYEKMLEHPPDEHKFVAAHFL